MAQGKFLLSFLIGATIGGIAAVLVAPDKGKNTWANIIDSSTDFFNRFKVSYNHAIDNVTSVLDSVGDYEDQEYPAIERFTEGKK